LGLQEWLQRGASVALDVASDGVSPVVRASAADVLLCATPPDIIAMRRSHAAIAHEWRSALREVMLASLRRGLSLHTMTRDGWYVFTAPAVDAEV
jgi:predicted GNAT superfamily acetyltransferase